MVSFTANANTTNLDNLTVSTIVQEEDKLMHLQSLTSFTQELKKAFY
jgi:hypothetical protein